MKPTGRERDKQIAELKGLNYGCERHKWNRIVPITCDVCGIEYRNRKQKYWSTSWNDAKELWDELPTPKEIYVSTNYYIGFSGGMEILGKDFPDAVSQAWIKWKEKQ